MEASNIVANVNIGQGDDPTYQIKQLRGSIGGNTEPKTFFPSLPQTQQELEELSISSSDYQIK